MSKYWMPLKDRVIIKKEDDEKFEGSTLIKPDVIQKTEKVGTIIHAGKECYMLKAGDVVLFARYSEYKLPLDKGEYANYWIANEEDILCVQRERE